MIPIDSITARSLTDLARTSPYSSAVLKLNAGLVNTVLTKQSREDGLAYIGIRQAADLAGMSPGTFQKTVILPGPWVSLSSKGQAGGWEDNHPISSSFVAVQPAPSTSATAPLGLIDPRHQLWRSNGPGPLAWRILLASAAEPFTTAQARSWLAPDRVSTKTVTNVLNRLQDVVLIEKASRGKWTWNALALDAYAEDMSPSRAFDMDQQEQEQFDQWHRDRLAQNQPEESLQETTEQPAAPPMEPVDFNDRRVNNLALLKRHGL